jgi:predicted metal-dependent RNase
MNPVNYATMSDRDLKQYFLSHREDKIALQTYLDRLNSRPRHIITNVDDPDFDIKIQAAILQKLQAADNNNTAD